MACKRQVPLQAHPRRGVDILCNRLQSHSHHRHHEHEHLCGSHDPLYIGSIGIVWMVHPRQRRKRAEKRKKQDLQ